MANRTKSKQRPPELPEQFTEPGVRSARSRDSATVRLGDEQFTIRKGGHYPVGAALVRERPELFEPSGEPPEFTMPQRNSAPPPQRVTPHVEVRFVPVCKSCGWRGGEDREWRDEAVRDGREHFHVVEPE